MVSKTLFSSESSEWKTPKWLYDQLNEEFHFDLDPCTTKDNPLGTPCFYTKEDNGLEQSWSYVYKKDKLIKSVFVNPPYNREIEKWLKKAIYELSDSECENYDLEKIVFLLPARTDTAWMHKYILPFCSSYKEQGLTEETLYYTTSIRFIKGRLKFGNSKNSAPFPSMLVIFTR